jgi:hypothetical protein
LLEPRGFPIIDRTSSSNPTLNSGPAEQLVILQSGEYFLLAPLPISATSLTQADFFWTILSPR